MPVSYRNGLGRRSGKRRKLVHDLTGHRFERLTVLRHAGYGDGHALWLCRCGCGAEKVVSTGNLRRGHVRSCGCMYARHGQSRPKTPTYRLWTKVRGRARCCARWKRSSFEEFMGDLVAAIGHPPPGAWLCRVNPRRAWSRNNVAWMSPEEARARKRGNAATTGTPPRPAPR